MAAKVDEFREEARRLERESEPMSAKSSQRRTLFARSELLIMKVQDYLGEPTCPESEQEALQEVIRRLETLSSKIKLPRASMGHNLLIVLLCRIDEIIRLVATWSFLILSSIFIALPCVLLLPVDHLLLHYRLVAPSQQINIYSKRFIARSMMALSGVSITLQDLRETTFANECSIVCFSHASTMDAFLISLAIPLRHYTMAKSDLFLIPYFAWCLLAFGGVPIVRSNRGQAIRALEEAALWAKNGQCVAIAPEG
ncbi:1-acyl-sn-glycerol-3-phosphate acyltransferase [archaeon]|nr:MAG: 1-acyl-sn-glycerol-3-phosphate acyltransferase [archaeon]